MRYYSHVLDVPRIKPFDKEHTRYSSWIGNFVKPLRDLELHDKYWFTYYGNFVRFRVLMEEEKYAALKLAMDELIVVNELTLRDEEQDLTLEGDLGCERFLSANQLGRSPEARAYMVLSYLHAIAELVIDNLVAQNDRYWTLETSTELVQNPNGSNFESLHHLFCNMTQVPLSVLITKNDPDKKVPSTLRGTFWGAPGASQNRKWDGDVDYTEIFLTY